MIKNKQARVARLAALFVGLAALGYFLFSELSWKVVFGLLLGYSVSLFGLYLFMSMEKRMSEKGEAAATEAAVIYFVRVVLMLAVIVFAFYFPYIDAVAVIVAILLTPPAAIVVLVLGKP